MMCGHCRAHVEEALNSIDGVKAIVTLDPPEATIEFADKEISLNELQQIVQNKAGDYKLHLSLIHISTDSQDIRAYNRSKIR